MLNYIKRILYTSGLWTPVSLNNKISVILGLPDLNVYKCSQSVTTMSDNVSVAITLLQHIVSIDYYTEYAIKLGVNINRTKITYIHRWYNINGVHIDSTNFITWVYLVKETNSRYLSGLVFDPDHKAYRNSVKIKPLLTEAEIIIDAVLKCY